MRSGEERSQKDRTSCKSGPYPHSLGKSLNHRSPTYGQCSGYKGVHKKIANANPPHLPPCTYSYTLIFTMVLPILPAIGLWKLLGIAYGTMVVAGALQEEQGKSTGWFFWSRIHPHIQYADQLLGLNIDFDNIPLQAHPFGPHFDAGYFRPRPRPHRPYIETQRYDASSSTTIALVFVVAIAVFLLLKEGLEASMVLSLGLGALCGIGLFVIRNEPNNQVLRQPAYPY